MSHTSLLDTRLFIDTVPVAFLKKGKGGNLTGVCSRKRLVWFLLWD